MSKKASISIFILALFVGIHANAQVVLNKPLELTGSSPADRQVSGLSDAVEPGDALNARTQQRGQHLFAQTTGVNQLTAILTPPLSSISVGTTVYLKFSATNSGPVQLSINGSVANNVVKEGAKPLDAGDLVANEVGTLVFDGSVYHLLVSRRMERRPCPSGMVAANELFCIDTAERDTLEFTDASLICGDLNARLCTWGEWYFTCTEQTTLGMQNMVGNWEWTNNTGNGDGLVRVVGATSCTHSGTNPATGGPKNHYRCCYSR